ncbi:MAG TPA: HEAT repeat domain-containing protein [Candidatus Binatia bacterium]|nr:HEAT repeat domain-containing protein [Candidatus Binatia bacterium]
MWGRKLRSYVFVVCLSSVLSLAQDMDDIASPRHRAWDILITASLSNKSDERIDGIRALGLLRDNIQARQFAEYALADHNAEVRRAAATTLGQIKAKESIPKLEGALSDKAVPVVMAAAESLRELKEEKHAYAIYYDLLTGERKTNDGIIARQLKTLQDPKQLAQIGISEGVGFIPFAGIGWEAYRTLNKKDPNPVRAVAASLLAHDPDPATGRALVKATNDKNWIVRAAAVDAIAQRGDPALLPHLVERFSDRNEKVRYRAAAAVVRLSAIEQSKTARNSR